MKNTLKIVAAAAMLAVTATSAQAQVIQYYTLYSTTGVAGSFMSALTPIVYTSATGSATLTFTGQPVATVNTPTFGDLGSVTLSNVTGTGFNFSSASNLIYMQIQQNSPVAGSAISVGTITGSVSVSDGITGSTASVAWSPQVNMIDGERYTIEPQANGQTAINASGTGLQTIRGFEETTATPEPASMILLGTGLVGMFGIARRKKNKV